MGKGEATGDEKCQLSSASDSNSPQPAICSYRAVGAGALSTRSCHYIVVPVTLVMIAKVLLEVNEVDQNNATGTLN